MTIAEELHKEIEGLPEPLAREVLDFVQFIRSRQSGEIMGERPKPSGKDLYSHLVETGLIDCMEAEEDLSESYKQHLWK